MAPTKQTARVQTRKTAATREERAATFARMVAVALDVVSVYLRS